MKQITAILVLAVALGGCAGGADPASDEANAAQAVATSSSSLPPQTVPPKSPDDLAAQIRADIASGSCTPYDDLVTEYADVLTDDFEWFGSSSETETTLCLELEALDEFLAGTDRFVMTSINVPDDICDGATSTVAFENLYRQLEERSLFCIDIEVGDNGLIYGARGFGPIVGQGRVRAAARSVNASPDNSAGLGVVSSDASELSIGSGSEMDCIVTQTVLSIGSTFFVYGTGEPDEGGSCRWIRSKFNISHASELPAPVPAIGVFECVSLPTSCDFDGSLVSKPRGVDQGFWFPTGNLLPRSDRWSSHNLNYAGKSFTFFGAGRKDPVTVGAPFFVFGFDVGLNETSGEYEHVKNPSVDYLNIAEEVVNDDVAIAALLEGGNLRAWPEGSLPGSSAATADVPCSVWSFAELNASFGSGRLVCEWFDVFQRDENTGSCMLLAEIRPTKTAGSRAELVAVTGWTTGIPSGCTLDTDLIEGTTGLGYFVYVGDYTYTNGLGAIQAVPHFVALRAVDWS